MIKIFQNPKKGDFCFGHFSSENYVSDNRVYIEGRKREIVTIKKENAIISQR